MKKLGAFMVALALASIVAKAGECSLSEKEILPKFLKARSTVNGNPLLLKVAQAKSLGLESCSAVINEVGWKEIKYVFLQKAPLRVVVLSSSPGSLFWKTERSFFLRDLKLEKKQKTKDIYTFEIIDPRSQARYSFELSPPSTNAKLRIK